MFHLLLLSRLHVSYELGFDNDPIHYCQIWTDIYYTLPLFIGIDVSPIVQFCLMSNNFTLLLLHIIRTFTGPGINTHTQFY